MGFSAKKLLKDEDWEILLECNRQYLQCFFKNVDYLCRIRYGSRNRGLQALKDKLGYSMLTQSVKAFKEGEYRQCDMTKLSAWCILFGEKLENMISIDYATERGINAT